MKWYGSFASFHINSLHYSRKKIYLKLKHSKLYKKSIINLTIRKSYFYFPTFWKFIYLKQTILPNITKELIFLYSPTYFFYFPIASYASSVRIDSQVNAICCEFFFSNSYFNVYWTFFKKIFYQFTKVFFKKIKFKGKGYYAYKNSKNVFALQFGYSHIIRLYFFSIYAKFLAKTIILVFGLNCKNIIKNSWKFVSVRSINIFTNRGIRFSKQIVYKKTGKISSYR